MAGSCVVVRRFDQHLQQCLLGVQSVLGLIPGNRARVVEQVEAFVAGRPMPCEVALDRLDILA